MATKDFFAKDYAEARAKLLAACDSAALTVRSTRHPDSGPDGEPLFMDTVWIGPMDAQKVLVMTSATHGVEGFCGSGCQVGFLRSGRWRELPRDVAVLIVHAINPYGFAWLRRVNENNVDLNRNFVDHAKPYPANARFAEIFETLCPPRWDAETLARTTGELAVLMDKIGMPAMQEITSRGQYTHPAGIFFGGNAPTWSNRTFREVLQRQVRGRRAAAMLDYHTGLGPYGYGELISFHAPVSAAETRASKWYGADQVKNPRTGESVSADLEGVINIGFDAELAGATEATCVAIEYGTYDMFEVFQSLRADNWLHTRGDPRSRELQQTQEIKAQIRRAFYPDQDDWKEMVWRRSVEIVEKTLIGLSAS
jgi:hypothetical protein